ncbi:MAG: choice-of-anchor Q domain-containing protein [Bacteroidota bacterium]
MRKFLLTGLFTLIFQLSIEVIYGQIDIVETLSAASGVWSPKPGTTSFYAQVWGGGSGGNTGGFDGINGFNGTGGGGGGSFSKTRRIYIQASSTFYNYVVGGGGGINQNGGDSWIVTNDFIAFGGVLRWQPLKKKVPNSNIELSYFGGYGGQSFRFFTGEIWQGGGGGSGRTTGNGDNGQDASADIFNKFHGYGGSGTGGGGKTNEYGPGIPGGGGSGDQNGARGEIRVIYTCDYSPGIIGNAHTVPYPAELPAGTDTIKNVSFPSLYNIYTYTYSWQDSSASTNGLWQTIQSANKPYLIIPAISQTTWYRRVINGCNPNAANNRSNVVRIRVFNPAAVLPEERAKNGRISGIVKSKNGVGVPGIVIRVQKTRNLKGSPQSFFIDSTTRVDGTFDVPNIFYGDASGDLSVSDDGPVNFTIIPIKADHIFEPTSITKSLDFNNPVVQNLSFTDNTVYTISGRVYQKCNNCIIGTPDSFGIPRVKLDVVPLNLGLTYTDSTKVDSIGIYNMVVNNPGNYTITPSFFAQGFNPDQKTLPILANTANVNFADTSTRRISGRLLDGANQPIGSGSLLLEGILRRKDSADVTTFRLRAPILADGSYSIRVPASCQYRASIESFTPGFTQNDNRYVRPDSVINFFKKWAPEPLIDVREKDSSRNLIYHRPPVIVIAGGLRDTACNNNASLNPGIIFRTNQQRYFQVNVFEGPPSLNLRIAVSAPGAPADNLGDFLRIFTSVHKRKATDIADTSYYRLRNASGTDAMLDTSIIPGAPETIAPFTKPFKLVYIDRFGRRYDTLPKSTVVGNFNPQNTFITASPEKVMMILHAPPGDQSTSFWEQNETFTTTRSWSLGSGDGLGLFVNASLGPTIGLEDPVSGIGFDIEIIATGSYEQDRRVVHNQKDEFVESTKSLRRYEVTKSPLFTEDVSGDLYIGNSVNYLMGDSKTVDFKIGTAPGGCLIESTTKPYIGVKGFKTEFTYSEAQIVNFIIPQFQKFRDAATTEPERKNYENQISVWQQTIDDNKANKQQATMLKNISFSEGGSTGESSTLLKSNTNTITYDVEITKEFAAEFGFRAAGVGISGGPLISMRETWGNDTTTSRESETTVGFVLQDDDPGDFYSVDIKKDRVYGTYAFDLVAGTSSCPPENGAQKRDLPQIISGDMRFENLILNGENNIQLRVVNRSESNEKRTVNLYAGLGTGQGLKITSDGVNLKSTPLPMFAPIDSVLVIPIKVEKSDTLDGVVSYPDVEFYLSDDCKLNGIPAPNGISIAKLSFNFANPCGNIKMSAPLQGWVVTPANNNLLPITLSDYNQANVNAISLQYRDLRKDSSWRTGFTVLQSDITTDSYVRDWNVANLSDTAYEIRLRLQCKTGSVLFSNSSYGVIDRAAPLLVGRPLPANRLFDPNADEISFTYNEIISSANLNSGALEMVSFDNGVTTVIPVNVTRFDRKIVVTPTVPLPAAADSFRVIAQNITDLVGNVSTRVDVLWFKLNTMASLPYAGSNVATVHLLQPSIAENNSGKLGVVFKLRQKTNKVTKLYFNLSGSALFDADYVISYDTIKQKKCIDAACLNFVNLPVFNDFAGSPGFVNIDSNKTEAIIYIDPIEDAQLESNETIRINLIQGGEYRLQDSVLAEATIINAIAPCVPGNTLYVNKNATGNKSGSSWTNAFTSLKDALALTCPNITQIWVAKGTYYPTANNNRDSAFTMRNNLAIYGGFAGNEVNLGDRKWAVNTTVLSGDIGTLNNNSDNSHHVIFNNNNGLNATAILDGFTITGGNAFKGDYLGNRGGGVHNYFSAPAFYNCIITGNNAVEYGGGMFNQGLAARVVNSVLAGNTANYGGGLYNEGATTELINCTFAGNQVGTTGGAMYTYGVVSPKVTNSIMWGNSSGIQNAGGATPVVANSIVQGGTPYLKQDSIFILKPAPGLGNIGDLRLRPCSPAINTANNTPLAGFTFDLAGNSRIALTTADMGAYERQVAAGAIIHVDGTATGRNDGSSWINAYNSVTNAINDLNQCAPYSMPTTIYIAKGTYTMPLLNPAQLNRISAIILGGYPNGGGNNFRNAPANPVILVGNVQVLKSVTMDGVRILKP